MSADADASKLTIALVLLVGLMVVEVVAGIVAHSLALLSDAGHMLTDAAALGLALVALRLALRPAKGVWTYGYKRVEIVSALINGVTLVVLAGFITYEGIDRLIHPPTVKAEIVLVVALLGVVVNIVATVVLARANRERVGPDYSGGRAARD